MLRLNQDTKTSRTDAIPGAKIGHIAHHINNDPTIFRQAEIVAIQAGGNMDSGSVEVSKPQVEAQANELVKVVKPLVEAKKVFIIDPVAGPIPKEAPTADHWAMVRQRMKKVAKKSKATWISLNHADWVPEEDIHEDRVHYSQSGAKKVMKIVGDKIKEETGVDVMAGMDIQEKPYGAIYRDHWKVGCYRCTTFHGSQTPCPAIPEASNSESDSDSNSDNSTIEEGITAHNISETDSWDNSDSDLTPTNCSASTSAATSASSAAASSHCKLQSCSIN